MNNFYWKKKKFIVFKCLILLMGFKKILYFERGKEILLEENKMLGRGCLEGKLFFFEGFFMFGN